MNLTFNVFFQTPYQYSFFKKQSVCNPLKSNIFIFFLKNILEIFGTKGFSSYLCIAFERKCNLKKWCGSSAG